MLQFDGIRDKVTLPDVPDVGDFTAVLRFVPIPSSGTRTVFCAYAVRNPAMFVYNLINNRCGVALRVAADESFAWVDSIPLKAPHFVAFRRSGGDLSIWLNGVPVYATSNQPTEPISLDRITIGGSNVNNDNNCPMRVGGFRLDLRAWSDDEIKLWSGGALFSEIEPKAQRYYCAFDTDTSEVGGAKVEVQGAPAQVAEGSADAVLVPGWPKLSPSGQLIAFRFRDASTGSPVTIAAVDASPTLKIDGGAPIPLARPMANIECDWVWYSLLPPPLIVIVDDAETDKITYSGTGWGEVKGYDPDGLNYGGAQRMTVASGDTATVAFTGLVPGEYVLSVPINYYSHPVYCAGLPRTTDARYEVQDASGPGTVFKLDQSIPPPDSRSDRGFKWSDLGRVTIGGKSALITVSNEAGSGLLMFDAIRLELIRPRPIPSGASVTFSAPSGWVSTSAGPVGASADVPVTLTTDAEWFPFDASQDHEMRIGYNIQNSRYDQPKLTYANQARAGWGWGPIGNAVIVKDDFGNLKSVTGGFAYSMFRSSYANGVDGWQTPNVAGGTWTLRYKPVSTNPLPNVYLGKYASDMGEVFEPAGKATQVGNVPETGTLIVQQRVTLDPAAKSYRNQWAVYTDGAITDLEIYGPEVPLNWDKALHPITHDLLSGRGFESVRWIDCQQIIGSAVCDFGDFADPRYGMEYSHRPLQSEVVSFGPVDFDSPGDPDGANRYFKGLANTLIKVTTATPHGLGGGIDGAGGRIVGFGKGTTWGGDVGWWQDTGGNTVGLSYQVVAFVTSPTTFTCRAANQGSQSKPPSTLAKRVDVSGQGYYVRPSKLPGQGAIPIVDMVRMINDSGVNPWINIPHGMSDAGVKEYASYLARHLDPSLKVRIELSNEIWNPGAGFRMYDFFRSMAIANGTNHEQEYYAKRVGEVHALFRAAFAEEGRESDVIRVLAAQAGWAGNTTGVSVPYCARQSPRIPIDELAVDTYFLNQPFTSDGRYLASEADTDEAHDRLDIEGLLDLAGLLIQHGGRDPFIKQHSDILKKSGYPDAKLVCYESAFENYCPYGAKDRRIQRAIAASRHRKARLAHLAYYAKIESLGVKLLHRYYLAGIDILTQGKTWPEYVAIGQQPGTGDGTDGLYDNANPFDLKRIVSTTGLATREWGALSLHGQTAPPTPKPPVQPIPLPPFLPDPKPMPTPDPTPTPIPTPIPSPLPQPTPDPTPTPTPLPYDAATLTRRIGQMLIDQLAPQIDDMQAKLDGLIAENHRLNVIVAGRSGQVVKDNG